jgi:hypothetical protein
MTTKTSRRRFFTAGGAAFGAGVAATVGAFAPASDDPVKRLRDIEDREAIRQLHLSFTRLIEQQAYEAAAELFDDPATGQRAIAQQLADRSGAFHRAYRQSASQQSDSVTLTEDCLHAAATFNVEVEVCTPLQDDCTAATMARIQGNVADLRWEPGRFEAKYVKTRGEWKVVSLVYQAS